MNIVLFDLVIDDALDCSTTREFEIAFVDIDEDEAQPVAALEVGYDAA